MRRAFSKRTEKNDHTNFDFFKIDRVHMKSLLLKSQINLHDNHSIDYYLRLNYLTHVAWTFEQRRRQNEEVNQTATTNFTFDLWQFQDNLDANPRDKDTCAAHSIAYDSTADVF